MTMTATLSARIVLVDDHPIVREGLAQLINQHDGLQVCGEAGDGPQAMKVIDQTKPDLAIVDLSLPDTSGLEFIKQLRAAYPKLPLLVLSMHEESVYAPRALQAGARGYIMKREARQNVVTAIRRVLEDRIYVSDKLASEFVRQAIDGKSSLDVSPVSKLTDRELEVFELIGQGIGTRLIAQRLHRSIKTIEAHREHIKDKLSLKNAAELSRSAVQWVQSRGGQTP